LNKNITIAGLGWLGQPFAASLIKQGYTVKGSVTDSKKAKALSTQGFEAYKVLLTETGTTGALSSFLKDTDVLAIMIPPGLRRNTGINYALKMAHFLHEIEASQINKVILVSSTAVYDDSQGVVTEKNLPNPQSNASKQLYDVEQIFFNAASFECSIVRFGGLYGGNRNPHIFNAVTPQHPTKKEYYTKQAAILGLEPPHYEMKSKEDMFKQVDSVNLKGVLDYEFLHSLM